MPKRLTWEEHKRKMLEKPEYRAAYEESRAEFEALREKILKRIERRKKLAEKSKSKD